MTQSKVDSSSAREISPEAIASTIVQKHVKWEEDAECYPQWHVDRSALLISIAQAIQDARQPVAIDEAEIASLADDEFTDENGKVNHRLAMAYIVGFRECARRNAAVVRWPSEEEIAKAYDEKRAASGRKGDTVYMMTGWIEASNWLKQKVMGEK